MWRWLGLDSSPWRLRQANEALTRQLADADAALQTLRGSEERYRQLYQGAPVPIHSADDTMRLINVNERWLELLGYHWNDVLGRPLTDFMTAASAREHRETTWPILTGGGAANDLRYDFVRRSGEVVPVLYSARAEGEAGDGTFMTFAVLTDITARTRAEAALRASEERYRVLVSGVVDYAIFMLDPNGMVTNWNAGAERIKGYRASEIVGQHFSRFYTEEDRARGEPQRALEVAAREGKYEAEALRVRKDGSRFWANVVIDALREDGRLIGFAKITRDVTERVRIAEALDETRAALAQAQKMEAVGQLTGGVAHDFNNLLTAIIGTLDLLLERADWSRERARPLLEAALRSAQRGARLTSGLLAFSRRQTLAPQVTDANRLVAGMSQLLRQTLGETIAIETVLAGGLWQTSIDPNQLESALLNLAINARDAMPDGGKLTIETGNTYLDDEYAAARAEVTAGQYVLVAVTDTGVGMDAETLGHAFEPFFTTKPEGRGTGLGLSQVFGFMKQSGGHVNIYSEPGHGTTVKLYLPRHRGDILVEDEVAHAPREVRGRNETVLVVEDDAEVRQFAVQALTHLGYRVFEAIDGPSALQLLGRHPEIEVLFSDVGLPGMNGRQLADAARARSPGLHVLFTTGYARNAIVHHGVLDPGVQLLGKPFTVESLARKLRQILHGQGPT
jgi:PAS domain S-box-containing protein